MTSREMSYMLASSNLNLNKMVWCYQIKLGHRQVRLFILDEWGDELARKDFGAYPSAWNMNASPKIIYNPSVMAGTLAEIKVVNADQISLEIEAHELVSDYISR
ncbi:hypothetical protein [Klebsiella pneumoniae]|uniref:hypothetical protein n=1 Tax=Klebsiella pneumoniae TaxID=573 RepID=UPI0022FDBBCC|nr:hypothetical protein [Klebsiella pneumoniae]MDA5464639.1 hypothetical protein [Klebsiella pneumoniae]